MTWLVKEVVGLPIHEDREVHPGITVPVPVGEILRKNPGDKITKAEMDEHGQTEDDIKALIKDGAIEEE